MQNNSRRTSKLIDREKDVRVYTQIERDLFVDNIRRLAVMIERGHTVPMCLGFKSTTDNGYDEHIITVCLEQNKEE